MSPSHALWLFLLLWHWFRLELAVELVLYRSEREGREPSEERVGEEQRWLSHYHPLEPWLGERPESERRW